MFKSEKKVFRKGSSEGVGLRRNCSRLIILQHFFRVTGSRVIRTQHLDHVALAAAGLCFGGLDASNRGVEPSTVKHEN